MALVLAFLAATFVAATTIPNTGTAKPSGCAESVCANVAASHACPGCEGETERTVQGDASACATVCAVMNAVLPAAAQTPSLPADDDRATARPAPSGIPVAPERAPPRTSIPA